MTKRTESPQIEAQRLADEMWRYCQMMYTAGVPAFESISQLTYLLFLKIADEQCSLPTSSSGLRVLPRGITWGSLVGKTGSELARTYENILIALGEQPGLLGAIYCNARNTITSPALLERLINDLINTETWTIKGTDVTGEAYDQLLLRAASDPKYGVGQCFTPRSLISAIVECLRPTVDDVVVDPACGTGGFLIAVHSYLLRQSTMPSSEQRRRLSDQFTLQGIELVTHISGLAVMNLLLHGMVQVDDNSPITVHDALANPPAQRASLVLTVPPFGRRSSISAITEHARQDFWVTTTNRQFNFLQHIVQLLATDGRAAVVLPDNVLFEGEGERIRRRLLDECDLHTILRLPAGVFYAPGVKANVLFFDRPHRVSDEPSTTHLWVYDLRSSQQHGHTRNPLQSKHLQEFVDCFRGENRATRRETEQFRKYSYSELVARDHVNLDIVWHEQSRREPAGTATPEAIARDIVEDLQAALNDFASVAKMLQQLQ